MSKFLTKLNKAIPPKARIAMLGVLVVIGIMGYLIISLVFSSGNDDDISETGLVSVSTPKTDNALVDNALISKDNEVSRKIQELKNKEIEDKKNKGGESYWPGVDLSKKKSNEKTKEDAEEEVVDDNGVVDLSSMFSNEDVDKVLSNRDEKKGQDLEDIKTKLDIKSPDEVITFNRDAYFRDVEQEISRSSSTKTINWKSLDAPSQITSKLYGVNQSNNSSAPSSNEPNIEQVSSLSKESVDKRRKQYYARFNKMQSEIKNKMNGNTSVVEQDSSNYEEQSFGTVTTDNANNSEGQEYASNKQYGAGEVIFALNDIEIVSNETNVVRATIAQNGDVYQAILLGNYTQIGDVLGVKFSSYMVDGKSYKINAIAVDAETLKSGLADDVDHHYFSRYFGIISAALLEGYSETLMNSSSTTGVNGTTTGNERIEKASERLQYSIGKVGEYLAPKLLQNIDMPSTVTINRDRGIGIMFMSDFRVPARK